MALTKAYLLIVALFLNLSITIIDAKTELKLLHVLSANKFYTPDFNSSTTAFEVPKNLTYKYFLHNAVDLPNSVKMDLFNLGVHLRNKYGRFLGSIYVDEIIKMQTMEFPVSIMAGELINAGLWPPVEPQIWKEDLLWQPIPFVYNQAKEDFLLLGTLCPKFENETLKVLKNHNLTSEHLKLLDYINKQGQIKVNNLIDVSFLHLALENSMELTKTYPEWLTKIYLSKDLLNATMAAYDLLSTTLTQKQLNGGSIIKTIIKDSKDYINGTLAKERKINVYSGDDRNFVGVLKNLNHSIHELPEPGAAIIFELVAENNDYFIKIDYYTGRSNETLPLKLNECDLLCPVNKFEALVKNILPKNESSICGSAVEIGEPSGASSNVHSTILLVMSLVMVYGLQFVFVNDEK